MPVPAISALRDVAADLMQQRARSQLFAIQAGALAAKVAGTSLDSTATAQELITQCQELIDQASIDVEAIYTRQFLKLMEIIGTGGSGGSSLKFSTIAAMRAAEPEAGSLAYVMGYYGNSDGGHGWFYYSSGDVTPDDGGAFIASDFGGNWVRIFTQSVNPRQWGARGNFVTAAGGSGADDTVAFRAMFAFAKTTGLPITGWAGSYQLTDSINIDPGFASPVDFGSTNGNATRAMFIYMNVIGKPLFYLTQPTRQTFQRIVCFFRPENGWNPGENNKIPQTNTEAFMFDVHGWGTSMFINQCEAYHNSGFLSSRTSALGTFRDQAALFDNMIQNGVCMFGYRGLNLDYGSGSIWSRMRFQTNAGGGGGFPGQPPSFDAQHCVYIGASGGSGVNNELMENFNIEWGSYSRAMIHTINSEIIFAGMHVEGINLPYNATFGSRRALIYQSGGQVRYQTCRIQDVHVVWGFIRKFGLFQIEGSPATMLGINNMVLQAFNYNPDDGTSTGVNTGGYYQMVRYFDDGGGAWYADIENMDDRTIQWEKNSASPTWWGQSVKALPPDRRLEIGSHFASSLQPFSFYTQGSLSDPTFTSEDDAPGVVTLNSGTATGEGQLAILDNAPVYISKGVYRLPFRFKLSSLPTGAGDDISVKIGFFTNKSAALDVDPADGVYFEFKFSINSDDAFWFTSKKNAGTTTRAVWIRSNDPEPNVALALKDTEPNVWYVGEIVINNDGTQLRMFSEPRLSSSWANITTSTSIPASSTPLYPQASISKIGAGANVTLKLDYIHLTNAINGI